MLNLFLRLLGDNLVLDLAVGGLRHDLLGQQLILLGVGATGNNLFRVCVPDNHTGNTYPSVYKRFTSSLLFPADDVSLPTIGGLQTYGLYIFHAADDSHVLVVQTGGSQQNPVGASYYLVSY